MDTEFIIITATGRSGSTMLQEIISTIPNSSICGEHTAIINSLLDVYKTLREFNIERKKYNDDLQYMIKHKIKLCSYVIYNYEKSVNDIRNVIINLFRKNNELIIGCKNITMSEDQIKLFKSLFPLTKFILHIRPNVEEQIKSTPQSYCQYTEQDIEILENWNKRYTLFHNNNNFTYLSTFDDLFDFDKIKNLENYLKCKFDKEQINNILNSYIS